MPPSSPAPKQPTDSAAASTPLRVLVALGPTQEPIDDVRYIGNRSSGRMGLAIAQAFAQAGCQVTAAAGPGVAEAALREAVGAGAKPGATARFRTARDLAQLLGNLWPAHDLLIMAAAVADFRPRAPMSGKHRRESGAFALELEPTEDILTSLAPATRPDQFVVGFALERPQELEASARAKLARKRVDAIVANPLETMDAPDVEGRVLCADGTWRAPGTRLPKPEFARWLCGWVLPAALERRAAGARTRP
ncbi:MAG: phosphopantothenoylcysteine decarboxylase [Phycisphaerales bacterium]